MTLLTKNIVVEQVFARLRKADRPLAVVGMVHPESVPADAGAWDVCS